MAGMDMMLGSLLRAMNIDPQAFTANIGAFMQFVKAKLEDYDARSTALQAELAELRRQNAEILMILKGTSNANGTGPINVSAGSGDYPGSPVIMGTAERIQ